MAQGTPITFTQQAQVRIRISKQSVCGWLYISNMNIFHNRTIGLMSSVFTNGLGDQGSIPGRVIPKTQKIVLDAALLSTQHNKVRINWRCPWCNDYRRRNWTWRQQFKSWTDCISHSTNTFGKGMNPIILPPAMGK